MTTRHVSSSRSHHPSTRAGEPDGVALLTMLVVLVVTAAFVAALVLTSVVETRISASWRDGAAALSAADTVARRALLDLASADWDAALGGTGSSFTDGPPSGVRMLDGGELSLDQETFDLACGDPSGCSDAEISSPSAERPWGPNNPHWRLFGYGPLSTLFPDDPYPLRGYVVSWVADDPTETDGDPAHDGAQADNPGRGLLLVTGQAYGPGLARRTVQLGVERVGTELRIMTWHERRP